MRGAYSRKTYSGVGGGRGEASAGESAAAGGGDRPGRSGGGVIESPWGRRAPGTRYHSPTHPPETTMPVRAVLFDFDGTLADSFGAITSSLNHVRESYGLPPLPERVVREYVGYGLPQFMRDLVPQAPTDEAVARYRAHHPTVMLTGTKLLDRKS